MYRTLEIGQAQRWRNGVHKSQSQHESIQLSHGNTTMIKKQIWFKEYHHEPYGLSSHLIKPLQNPIANSLALFSFIGSYSPFFPGSHTISKISPPFCPITLGFLCASESTRPLSAMISLLLQLLQIRTTMFPSSSGPLVQHIHLSSMSLGANPLMRLIMSGPGTRMFHFALSGLLILLMFQLVPYTLSPLMIACCCWYAQYLCCCKVGDVLKHNV